MRDRPSRIAAELSALGYALPGSVLAVGVMMSFAGIDNALNTLWRLAGGGQLGPVLSGSLAALLLAYLVRFLAVANGPVGSALERLRPSVVEAARGLGARGLDLARRIYLPLLRPGLLTAALLVSLAAPALPARGSSLPPISAAPVLASPLTAPPFGVSTRGEFVDPTIRQRAVDAGVRWARVGMIGHPYQHMLDLMIDPFAMREKIGPTVVHIEPEEVASLIAELYRNEAISGETYFLHGGLRLGSKG